MLRAISYIVTPSQRASDTQLPGKDLAPYPEDVENKPHITSVDKDNTAKQTAELNGTAIAGWSVKQQSYFDRKSETWVNNTYYSGKTKCTVIATFVMTQEERFNLVGKTIIPPNAYGMNKQKHQVNILPLLGSWHGDVKTNQGSFFIADLPKNTSLNDHMFRIAEIIWKETHGEIEKNKVTISVDKFNVADQGQLDELKKKYNINKKKWGNRVLNDGWLQPNAINGPSEEDLISFNNEKSSCPEFQ
jgi:hypothetical protein